MRTPHDVQYRLELSDGLPPLEVHRTQIQHVILNLVRNAIESIAETPDKPREIVVRTSRTRDGAVEVSVCDSGPGVSSGVRPAPVRSILDVPNLTARASALRSAVPSSQSTAVPGLSAERFRSVPASPCAYPW